MLSENNLSHTLSFMPEPFIEIFKLLSIKDLSQFSLVNKAFNKLADQFWEEKFKKYFPIEYNSILIEGFLREPGWQKPFRDIWNKKYSKCDSEYKKLIESIFDLNFSGLSQYGFKFEFYAEWLNFFIYSSYSAGMEYNRFLVKGKPTEQKKNGKDIDKVRKLEEGFHFLIKNDDLAFLDSLYKQIFNHLKPQHQDFKLLLLCLKISLYQLINKEEIKLSDQVIFDNMPRLIFQAAKFGNLNFLKLLDRTLPRIQQCLDECFIEALYLAAENGYLEVVKFFYELKLMKSQFSRDLLCKPKNFVKDIFYAAVNGGNINIVQFFIGKFLEEGIDIIGYHAKKAKEIKIYCLHPLYYAVKNYNYEMINFLIEKGAELEEYDEIKGPGFAELIKCYLDVYCVIKQCDKNGNTPLHLFILNNKESDIEAVARHDGEE